MKVTEEPIDDDLVRKSVSLTPGEMQRLGQDLLDVLNRHLDAGEDKLLTISSALYAVGAAIAQFGIVLAIDDPVRQALPPLVAGYVDGQISSPRQQQ